MIKLGTLMNAHICRLYNKVHKLIWSQNNLCVNKWPCSYHDDIQQGDKVDFLFRPFMSYVCIF